MGTDYNILLFLATNRSKHISENLDFFASKNISTLVSVSIEIVLEGGWQLTLVMYVFSSQDS